MIHLEYNIALEVGDRRFDIVAKRLNKMEEDELTKKANDIDEARKVFAKKEKELTQLSEEYRLNEEIFEAKQKEKKPISSEFLLEHKNIYKKLVKLVDEIKSEEKKYKSISDVQEEITKFALKMQLSGKDVAAFFSFCDEMNVSYISINNEIKKQIKVAMEKK